MWLYILAALSSLGMVFFNASVGRGLLAALWTLGFACWVILSAGTWYERKRL